MEVKQRGKELKETNYGKRLRKEGSEGRKKVKKRKEVKKIEEERKLRKFGKEVKEGS